MSHRREIDGLRAIAVIPVILFHAGFRAFSGGFVGVDIFFVISGYLITSIIIAEKQLGVFTLARFYERRARRILPALLFVMLACLPFAWLWMWPSYMKNFSDSLIAATTFASNIFFWRGSGYFNVDTELQPLLHTWSLAVEEQYYLLFPLFLLLIWGAGKKWVVSCLLLITIISFALAQWGALNMPMLTFYLLPTRGWELLIGALIAFCITNKPKNNTIEKISQLGGLVGVLLIAYSVFLNDKNAPFPSLFTLAATLGAGCVIVFATSQTLVGRLLGCKLFVGVGLISYSAYLWHQPLFAFARIRLNIVNPSFFLLMSGCSLILAYFSWKYIEIPFRDKKNIRKRYFFLFVFLLSVIIIASGIYGHIRDGAVIGGGFNRLSTEQKKLELYTKYNFSSLYREGECDLKPNQSYKDFSPKCKEVAKEKSILLIWGDSNAAALSSGLRAIMPNVVQYTASACPPIMDVVLGNRPQCKNINDFILREVEHIKPSIIMLHANWSRYGDQNLGLGIARTINRIMKASTSSKVYIIGSVPQWPISLPIYMLTRGISLEKRAYVYNPRFAELELLDEKLRLSAMKNGVSFLSILDAVCNKNGACQSVAELNGRLEPTAWDYGHLTEASSLLFAKKLLEQINQQPILRGKYAIHPAIPN